MDTQHQLSRNSAQEVPLEQECQRLRQEVERLRNENNYLRKFFYTWSRSQCNETELRRWLGEQPEGVSFDELMGELARG